MADSNKALKKTFKLMVILVCVMLFLLVCASGYKVMYEVFADTAMEDSETSEGDDIVVRIDSGMSNYQIGVRLENNGLIKNAFVFAVQCKLFVDDDEELQPGTYTLNTTQTGTEIIETFIAGEDDSSDEDTNEEEED